MNGVSPNVSTVKFSLDLLKSTEYENVLNIIKTMESQLADLQIEQSDIFGQNTDSSNVFQQTEVNIGQNIHEKPLNLSKLTSNLEFEEYIFIVENDTHGISNFRQTFDQLKQMGQMYVDLDFRADQSILGGKLDSKVQAWMRPQEIWTDQNYELFVKDLNNDFIGLGKWINSTDIKQGKLGDCYFLASVSSIACQRPDIILGLFITRKLNSCGIYCVRFNIDGQWTAVTVDDQFPTRKGRPVFTRSEDRELWVMILEKAWAKIFGSYLNIAQGKAREVMSAFTGAPTKTLMTNELRFLEELEKYCLQRCIMVAESKAIEFYNEQKQIIVDQIGLVPGHAYSILKIQVIIHPELGMVNLVKLRNPWGKKEWQGNWSDSSNLWTPDLKKQLNYASLKKGVFYMDISSFIEHFSNVQVCQIRPSYHFQSQKILSTTKKNSIYLKLLIDVAGEYFFTVTQRNKRFKDAKEYSPVRIVVGHLASNGEYKLAASCNQKADREIYCTGHFKVGVYFVQVKINWQHSDENTFTYSSYGIAKVGLDQVKKIPDLIRSIFMDQSIKFQPKKLYKSKPNIFYCKEFNIDHGHGYYYVENRTENFIEFSVNFEAQLGIKLCKPDRGVVIKIALSPGRIHLSVFTISANGYSKLIFHKQKLEKQV